MQLKEPLHCFSVDFSWSFPQIPDCLISKGRVSATRVNSAAESSSLKEENPQEDRMTVTSQINEWTKENPTMESNVGKDKKDRSKERKRYTQRAKQGVLRKRVLLPPGLKAKRSEPQLNFIQPEERKDGRKRKGDAERCSEHKWDNRRETEPKKKGEMKEMKRVEEYTKG